MNDVPLHELGLALFEESGDALFLFDPDTDRMLEVNRVACQLSGFSREALLQQPATYLFHFEGKGGRQRLRQASSKTGIFHSQDGFFLRTDQDGVWIPVNLTVTRLHVKPKTLALIAARDIRDQREARARTEQAEAELRRVLASVAACLWSAEIDTTGRWVFRYFSPVVEKITGQPPAYFLGPIHRWREVIHADDRARWKAALIGLQAGQSSQEEYRVVRPDGSLRWVRDSVMVNAGPEERTLRLDGVLADVTEQKLTEEALRATQEEFRAARRIQQRLFPDGSPAVAGYDVAGRSYPAQATGGDYYDFLPLRGTALGVVIGDVSGHGFGPALLMAATRAYLRVLARIRSDVGEILTLANRVLAEDTDEDRFITLLLASLDPSAASLVYASAGHVTGHVLNAAGDPKTALPSLGLPLGIAPERTYATSPVIPLAPGDVAFLLTDGLIEAPSPSDEAFGIDRALAVVRGRRDAPAGEIIEALHRAIREHCQHAPQNDDVTAIVIKRNVR